MKKILFLIHDLGQGGAEKVLVNLVNNMDKSVFDITVMAMFGGGVNEQFLSPEVKLVHWFKKSIPGNSHLMKLLSPRQLHKLFIREHYDIEVSYLEGCAARVVSGCPYEDTKLVSWIHSNIQMYADLSVAFRNRKEAIAGYSRFDRTVCVSETIKSSFTKLITTDLPVLVLYNTIESNSIMVKAQADAPDLLSNGRVRLIAVGTLKEIKGFDRLLRVTKRLHDAGCPVHLYILGKGPLKGALEEQIARDEMGDYATLLGYHTNPYAYVAKSDVFVCSSHSEGFSTAATEALIVGTPVCTVEVSGMKEMLGEHNEYGVVTDNNEDALYEGLHHLLTTEGAIAHYKQQAAERGKQFRTEETLQAVEQMLLKL